MMKMNDAKRAFDELARRSAEPFGFTRRASLTFARMNGASEAFLLFGLRKAPSGYFAATGSVGLRFKELNQLIEGSPTNGIHINVPLHLIGDDHSFREWQFATVSQLDALAAELTDAIASRVIPFVNDNGSLDAVRDRLSSSAPKNWYVLTPEQRTTLLVAVQWALGEKATAVATIDSALSKLADALPKKRVALESLRAKLCA